MKEITRIHLAKISYEIELDAKDALNKYFTQLKTYAKDDSIFSDVEIRVTEILADNGIEKDGIITLADVEKIKLQLGDPKIFSDDQNEESIEDQSNHKKEKRFYRDTQNGVLGGVLSGVSSYFNIDVAPLRIVSAILLIFPPTSVFVFVLYLVTWAVVKPTKTATDVLRLKNEKVSASNLRAVNEEYDFEAINRRKKTVLKVLSIIAGVFSLLISLGGIFAIVLVTPTILSALPSNDPLYNSSILLPYGLFLAAGISFVLFFMMVSHSFFVRKIKSWQVFILISLTIMGIMSFATGILIANNKWQEVYSRQRTLKVKDLGVSSDEISNINKLEAVGKINIRYMVDDKFKIEFHSPEYSTNNIRAPKFKIDNDLIKIEDDPESIYKNKVFGSHDGIYGYDVYKTGVLVIYGPHLDEIKAKHASVEYSLVNKELNKKTTQEKLHVSQSHKAHVIIDGRSAIRNLDLNINDSDFYGTNTSVENLTLSTYNEGIIRLKDVKKSEITTDDACLVGEQSFLRLGILGGENTLNGQKYDDLTSCFKIERERNYYD